MADNRIKILDPVGILPVELYGLGPIEDALPAGWLAYAGLELVDPRNPNIEFDLVLVTHDRVLVVELKHWSGRITSERGQWFQNGSTRGKSAVTTTGEKIKILKEHLRRRDPKRFTDVWVDMRVVLTAGTDFSALEQQDKDHILPLNEFLRVIGSQNVYKNYFRPIRRAAPLYAEKDAFNRFFIGQDFKPAERQFQGFRADGPPTFEHPEKLFAEYQSVHVENPRRRALLRVWNGHELAIRYQTPAERDRLFKREGRVLAFLSEKSPDLKDRNCLPTLIGEPGQDEATHDFFQLFDLSQDRLRLPQFITRNESKLTEAERLAAIRSLLAVASSIHQAGVAHCDLGDHTLWLGRDGRIVVTGFTAAQYPEEGTLGSARSSLVASHMRLPEDVLGGGSTGFSRDVFHIGVATYRLAFLEPPPLEEDVPHWNGAPHLFCGGAFDDWFARAIDHDYTQRPKNAIELAESFARAEKGRRDIEQPFDVAKLLPFQTNVVPFVKFPVVEQMPSTQAKIHYVSKNGQQLVHVKVFTDARTDANPRRAHSTFRLLSSVQRWQQIGPGYAPAIQEYGLSSVGAYSVECKLPGQTIKNTEIADAPRREQAALWVALEVRHLHASGLHHGDLCDRNILLADEADCIRRVTEALAEIQREQHLPTPAVVPFIIDMVEYVEPDGIEPYTPAFAPPYVEKCSPAERDRFAVCMIVARLIGLEPARCAQEVTLGDASPRYRAVRELLQQDLNAPAPILSLDPLIDALSQIVCPAPPIRGAHYGARGPQLPLSGVLQGGEDGLFVQIELPRPGHETRAKVTFLSSGGDGLEILWDIQSEAPVHLKLRRVPFHVYARLANSEESFRVRGTINYSRGPLELGPLADKIRRLVRAKELQSAGPAPASTVPPEQPNQPAVRPAAGSTRATLTLGLRVPQERDDEGIDSAPTVNVAGLWRTLLEVEAELLPQIEVVECRRSQDALIVSYGEQSFAFQDHDEITVRQVGGAGRTRPIGRLDLGASRNGELVIRKAEGMLKPGEILLLESRLAKASYDRRRAATERILTGNSAESRLKSWLDPNAPWPSTFATPVPKVDSAAELSERYRLNPDQGRALWGAITGPPVVLVQGPPGTGKTTFIAALCHYLTETAGATNVLVASQSHEAVDNAAEAVANLYRERSASADLVRVGSAEQIASDLSPFHTSTWRHAYLTRFDIEWPLRLETISQDMGIDRKSLAAMLPIYRDVGPLVENYESIERRLLATNLTTYTPDEEDEWRVHQRRLEERIQMALGSGVSVRSTSVRRAYDSALLAAGQRSGSVNQRNLKQLDNVIRLAFEWRDVLAMNDARFDEFLVRTKQIVCGTCVGLGAASYGLAEARYDWVIVDEAGRCTPSELAVAVQSGHRIILVGDHRQLPPFFDDQMRHAMKERFPSVPDDLLFVSDFQRIFDRFKESGAGFALYGQHRMAPSIGALVSDVFYAGELTTERGPAEEWTQTLPPDLAEEVVWLDTASAGAQAHESKERHSLSFQNHYEAGVIVKLLEEIDASDQALEILLDATRPVPIGVICPYKAQASLIRNLLAKSSVSPALQSRIKVGTVDSYQGKQNDLIVLSLTRANTRGDIGFVRDKARANVSLSRARERLVIVGSSATWGHPRAAGSPFSNVLDYVRLRTGTPGYAVVDTKRPESRT